MSTTPAQNVSDHLANERTFLAWIRTSIAVMGLGFVVAKFAVWLRELSARLPGPPVTQHGNLSTYLGIAMIGVGAGLSILAAWRYRAVRLAILNGTLATADRTTIGVSVITALIAIALIAYMIASAG
ncbi:MAG TPA: DUF202 domain-containing protein [Tepidisphaeraceae bacterium]|nr:DUF202 domain-containing protein [Tepidisphaeraceae bacterium]